MIECPRGDICRPLAVAVCNACVETVMTDSTVVPQHPPTNVRRGVFALACGTSWLLYFHRYTFALIKPDLKQQWGLGSDDLGLLDSAFFTSYTAFQIPLGIAGDIVG